MEQNYEELVKRANEARRAYYNGEEIMSNHDYDAIYDAIDAMEKESGVISPDSPTQAVGYDTPVVKHLKKVTHEYPALSLAKTKDIDSFVNTFEVSGRENNVTLMWKLDGSTVQLTYIDGKLAVAATRGNGEVGQDITHNAPFIKGIPTSISHDAPHKLIVRGEATMSYSEFDKINNLIPEDEKYANPRNLANATISMLSSFDMRKREIEFHAFELVCMEDSEEKDIRPVKFHERLTACERLGFGVVPYVCTLVNELKDEMNLWSDVKVKAFDVPVDGLVAAYDDCSFSSNFSGTAHNPHPLVGYAFKWADDTVETTLRQIEWSASRTGLLNPVAVFDPVELEGTTVTRSTLHNVSEIERLKLHVGDKISVYKANKIIPAVAENLTPGDAPVDIPQVCPVCGCSVDVATSKVMGSLTKTLWCKNPGCMAKHAGKFTHFAERDCMNIDGLSEATIEKFIDAGFIKEFADLYHLDRYQSEIVSMDGFGQKSYDNLIAAVEKSRETSFVPFVHALGITGIGKGQAKLLDKEYNGDIDKFFEDVYSRHDFSHIDGIGEVLQNNLLQWGNEYLRWIPFGGDMSNVYSDVDLSIYHLMNEITYSAEEKKEEGTQKLAGMTFVITGSVEHFTNRDAIRDFIEANGGKTSGSVSAKTTYLVNNDITSTSGKNKKAKELGVAIISEQQLLDLTK